MKKKEPFKCFVQEVTQAEMNLSKPWGVTFQLLLNRFYRKKNQEEQTMNSF